MGKLTRPVVLSVVVALTIAGCGGGKHALRADTAQAATGSVPGHNCKPSNRRIDDDAQGVRHELRHGAQA